MRSLVFLFVCVLLVRGLNGLLRGNQRLEVEEYISELPEPSDPTPIVLWHGMGKYGRLFPQ